MRWAVVAGLQAASALSCAPSLPTAPAPAAATVRSTEPRWQDVFEPLPDFLVVVRPRVLRRDAIYGPLLRRVLELARQESAIVTATRALDAVEDADEVVLGVDVAGGGRLLGWTSGDLVCAIRGVRADLDPARLVDDRGRLLWSPGPAGPVRELVVERDRDVATGADTASLFELPGRTWIVATGSRRRHARGVFLRAVSSPPARAPLPGEDLRDDAAVDPEALAAARLSGPSLVARMHALRPPALLAPVGHELATVTIALSPGTEAVLRATLRYEGDDAVGPAETTVRRALTALSGSKPEEYGWLAAASVQGGPRRIVLTLPLPRELIEALLPRSPTPRPRPR